MKHMLEEYGATTGRPRQCNWADVSLIEKASKINGVTKIVFNKVDILRELGQWNLIIDGETTDLQTEENTREFIKSRLNKNMEVFFSDNPHSI